MSDSVIQGCKCKDSWCCTPGEEVLEPEMAAGGDMSQGPNLVFCLMPYRLEWEPDVTHQTCWLGSTGESGVQHNQAGESSLKQSAVKDNELTNRAYRTL